MAVVSGGPKAAVQAALEAAGILGLFDAVVTAYLPVLHYSQLDLRRAKYEREGKLEKLREVETKWSKNERVRLCLEAVTAVEAFGSQEMRKISPDGAKQRWRPMRSE